VLWELHPVLVAGRPFPQPREATLPDIEAGVFDDEDVDIEEFQAYLRENRLALIVSRNVTQRDRADRHQPFNLRVPGGVQSLGAGGTVYDVADLQLFQGDAVRGYGDLDDPNPGRRLLARPMHEPGVSQVAGGPTGAVAIAADGSMAALVPANRALSWQLTDPNGGAVVRERNWLSFQAGEIRVCASCHGINKLSQTGDPAPTNEPEALHELLAQWKETVGGETGDPGCGQPATSGAQPLASDALQVLRAAVGNFSCLACVCDVDDSQQITTTDALMTLKKAVGQPVTLSCPVCGVPPQTTTTTVPSTGSTVTTTTSIVTPGSTVTTSTNPDPTTTTTVPVGGLFEASNPWNQSIESAAVSPESAAIVQTLENAGGWGTGTLRIDFSIHLLEADTSTPRKTFSQSNGYYTPDCDPSFPFPVPVGGAIEGRSNYSCTPASEDCHLLVVERDEKLLYELYGANISNGGVLSGRCGVVWDLTRAYPSELRGEQCTSADAAGLPIGALLFTADEVAAGEIAHAIRFILPNPRMRASTYVHPATHAGAPSGVGSYPPYGARFRLRADYPIESLADVNARVVARAMQKYGMILSDGGNIALTAASDSYTTHSWDELGIDSYSLADLQVSDFEVLDFGTPIALTYDCVRAE
jgi:hypothetical protein